MLRTAEISASPALALKLIGLHCIVTSSPSVYFQWAFIKCRFYYYSDKGKPTDQQTTLLGRWLIPVLQRKLEARRQEDEDVVRELLLWFLWQQQIFGLGLAGSDDFRALGQV